MSGLNGRDPQAIVRGKSEEVARVSHVLQAYTIVIANAVNNAKQLAASDKVASSAWFFAAALMENQASSLLRELERLKAGIVVVPG